MSVSKLIINTLKPLKIPVEVMENTVKTATKYVVLIPLADQYVLFTDNKPKAEVCEMELAVYTKGNYLTFVSQIVKLLIDADITITDRKYIEYETDTKLHHYAIDVAVENYFKED